MDGNQWQKKKFTVPMNQSKKYANNYDRINWHFYFAKCPDCGSFLSLLEMKDKETNKNQYYCKKCNRKVIL